MKKFLIQFGVFFSLLIISFLAILLQADGYSDPYYLKFTAPQQENLILGTSKAAQGLNPDVFDRILDKKIFNYSFNIGTSPYGPKYLQSIKRKLKPETKNGIFILTVDAWSLSVKNILPDDTANFRENGTCIGELRTVNNNPNFPYLINYMFGENYKLIFKSKIALLHENGWYEINLPSDSVSVKRRKDVTISQYKNELHDYKFSQIRFEYLKETIAFLNKHGRVFLVRLPVSAEMYQIENQLISDFDSQMTKISNETEGYFNLTFMNDSLNCPDGLHLDKKSGIIVAEYLAKLMK